MSAKLIDFIKKKYLLFILILFVFMAGLLLNPDVPRGGSEDTWYLMLAKSISSHQGYRDIFYPSSPPELKHFFFYPFLLSKVLLFFPQTIIGLKIVSIIFAIASLSVLFILFKKWLNTRFLYWVIFFVVINSWFLHFSVSLRTEIIYLFFSLVSFLFLEKYKRQDTCINIYLFVSVLTTGMAFFTRPIGFSIILSAFIYFCLEGQYKKAFLVVGLWSILISPWIIWILKNAISSKEIISESYLNEAISKYQFNIKKIVKWNLWNILCYWRSISHLLIPGYFLGKPDFEGEGYFKFLYSIINKENYFNPTAFPLLTYGIITFFSSVTLCGFISCMKKGKTLVNFYVLCYLIALIIFPAFYVKTRYLVPLLPFILYYLFSALSWPKLPKLILKCTLLILLSCNLPSSVRLIKANVDYLLNRKGLSVVERQHYYVSWFASHFIAANWVEKNTSANAVIMEQYPVGFYLSSKRKTVFFDETRYWPPKRSFQEIKLQIEEKDVDYIITYERSQEQIIKWLDGQCRNIIFHPLVKFKSGCGEYLVKVYKVVGTGTKIKLLNEKGMYFYDKGNFSQAIFTFKEALKIEPNFVIFYNLGQSYEKKGLWEKALQVYRKAIDLQPNYEIAEKRFNIIYQREMVKNNPDDALAWEKLGIYYLGNYDYSIAIDNFNKALELNPDLPLSHYHLGIAYINNERYVAAIIELKQALKLEPKLKCKVNHYIKVAKKKERGKVSYVLHTEKL